MYGFRCFGGERGTPNTVQQGGNLEIEDLKKEQSHNGIF